MHWAFWLYAFALSAAQTAVAISVLELERNRSGQLAIGMFNFVGPLQILFLLSALYRPSLRKYIAPGLVAQALVYLTLSTAGAALAAVDGRDGTLALVSAFVFYALTLSGAAYATLVALVDKGASAGDGTASLLPAHQMRLVQRARRNRGLFI